MSERSKKIANLNDAFRSQLLIGLAGGNVSGRYHITGSLQKAFGPNEIMQVFHKVATFDQFTPDNDPYGEHDFGAIHHGDEDVFWKIDYYDRESLDADEEYGSEDPSDPEITTRIMTIMLAQDY